MTVPSIVKPAIPYEQHIATLLANYLRPKTESVATLAMALGCRHIKWRDNAWHVPAQKALDDCHEELVTQALISALHWHVRNENRAPEDGLILLDGLLKNDRWRECLSTIASSHDFAMLLIRQVSKLRDAKVASHPHPLMLAARTMINEWLNIDQATYTYIPLARPLAAAMFGTAWCDLMLPADRSERTAQVIEELIESTRPAFMSGICQAQDVVPKMTLPALDWSL